MSLLGRMALRRRAMLAFGLLALVVSSIVAIVAYEVTRSTLISQRETGASRQAFLNARSVRAGLLSDVDDPSGALARTQTSTGGLGLVRVGDTWFSTSVSGGRSEVPPELLRTLDEGSAARQRVERSGEVAIAVGVPLAGADAVYVELVPVGEVARTLEVVGRGLLAAVAGATAAGLAIGRWLSGRILRPVRETAAAADEINEGHLDRRLEGVEDPDLRPLVEAFNQMVDGLQARIDRESRFASDVTHELRSPLATMDAALSVANRRVDDPAGREALDVLGTEVARFRSLILDLLEIGRAEAGVAELALGPVDPVDLVQHLLEATHREDIEVVSSWEPGRVVALDKRRIGQAVVNVLDNADNYGGGARTITIAEAEERLRIEVDDHGPGVPEHERQYIFNRFARGAESSAPGTGLGLALVAEHVRLHGGTVTVTDRPGGGARFVIEIPVADR
ncbi:MAG: HAMP domain-containing sensor histidine kinase [Acidimicrobiales bacterium]|nr:HAMP domain-containing histidine kinase [Actinomycetota bacterium]